MKRFKVEEWKFIEFEDNISENEVYQISNYGRVKSFKKNKKKGKLIKLFPVREYLRIPLKQKNGKRTARYVHKLVAKTFISKENEGQEFVLHLNYKKLDNYVENLQWATRKEKEAHQFHPESPTQKNRPRRVNSSKLTEGRVRMIKRKLLDPNRKTRLKIIAKNFGVSEMQLHRIKTGENWGHVKID